MSETNTAGQPRPEPELIIPIDPPIEFQGAQYTQIVLREPTIDQKRAASEHIRNGMNAATVVLYEQHLISLVSKAPVGVVGQLKVGVLNRAMTYLDFFLNDGRRMPWS